MAWQAIQPYTDPALEHLAAYLATGLNCDQPPMVRRWVVSEILSYKPEEYPLLQVQNLKSIGEALEKCQGSIRYCVLNQQIQLGEQQQTGFRWVQRAIAKLLRDYKELHTFVPESPMLLGDLTRLTAEIRTGPLKTADGSVASVVTWVEIFFDYADRADIGKDGQ